MPADRPPLQPTRDPRVTLDDLVEVLLNKGAVLHLDLIIAVADIPLIGVSLRAAVAGMETMLEHGMMRQWDEKTRAWAERSALRRGLGLVDGEEHVTQMPGGRLMEGGLYTAWQPGTVHLTDRRLVVLRREPREVLWETELAAVRAVTLETERSVGGEPRTRVRVERAEGDSALLSAADPERLRDLLESRSPALSGTESSRAAGGTGGPRPVGGPSAPGTEPLLEGHLWYQEPRRDGPLWRGGQGRVAPAGLVWKSPLDARPALVVPAADLVDVRPSPGHGPGGEGTVLTVETGSQGAVTVATDDPARWVDALRGLVPGAAEAGQPA